MMGGYVIISLFLRTLLGAMAVCFVSSFFLSTLFFLV